MSGKISTYPEKTTPAGADYLLGDDTAGAQTARFKIQNIPVDTKQMHGSCKFKYYRAGAWTPVSGGALLPMDTEVYDTGGNYNPSTGEFTAPVSGWYIFGAKVAYSSTSGVVLTGLCYNGTAETTRLQETGGGSGNVTQSGSEEFFMNAGDTMAVWARAASAGGGTGSITTGFWGSLKCTA